MPSKPGFSPETQARLDRMSPENRSRILDLAATEIILKKLKERRALTSPSKAIPKPT